MVRLRALVGGESVSLTGTAPAGCDPILRLDDQLIGPVTVGRGGSFDLSVETRDLAAGRHVAEVFCTSPSALLLSKTFWVTAPGSSSNILFVALVCLLMLVALGWVGVQTLAGGAGAAGAAQAGAGTG